MTGDQGDLGQCQLPLEGDRDEGVPQVVKPDRLNSLTRFGPSDAEKETGETLAPLSGSVASGSVPGPVIMLIGQTVPREAGADILRTRVQRRFRLRRNPRISRGFEGGACRARTGDPQLAKLVLSQLS